MPVRKLNISEDTAAALEELANITDADGRADFAKLLQDALRTYEWIIAQQAQGRVIAALEEADMKALMVSERASGEREALDSLIAPDKFSEAQAYFRRPAVA